MSIGQTSAQMALRDPDIRLMLRVRAGDQAAFAELVERYQHRLVGVMHHLVGHADEAEDLAQEVFVILAREIPRFERRREGSFRAWLRQIAVNRVRTHQRLRRRSPDPRRTWTRLSSRDRCGLPGAGSSFSSTRP